MGNFIKILLTLLLATATLSACGEFRWCEPGDKIDLVELEDAAKQNKVEEIWGAPIETVETDDGRIDAYSFVSDQGCYLIIVALFPYPPIPTDLPSKGYFTTEYGPNGGFKSIRVWHNADSPGEAVERHLQSLADEEARAEETAECEAAISEAVNLDRDSLHDLKVECEKALGPEKRWMLTCLLAHQSNASAQYSMGYHYQTLGPGFHDHLLNAYIWYSLSNKNGVISTRARDLTASRMTPSKLSEAEQLVINWQPNPAECEVISRAEAGSTQPD